MDGFVDLNGNGRYDVGEPTYCANGSACMSLGFVTSVNRFSHVIVDMGRRFGVSAANLLTTLQKEMHFVPVSSMTSVDPMKIDQAMGCSDLTDPSNLGFIPQLVCGAGALRGRFAEPATQNLEFFPAPSGVVDPSTPQIAAVCSDTVNQGSLRLISLRTRRAGRKPGTRTQ